MNDGQRELQRAQPWLGTLVSIRLRAARAVALERLHALMDAAFQEVARVHRCMSYHAPDSTLSHINRFAATRAVEADPDTHRVLRTALDFAAESDGAFDPTVAGRLEDWGYLPRPHRCAPAMQGSWRDVELNDHGQVRLHRALRVDLGGIAKGYAVDRASQLLDQPDVESFLINAGGDLRLGGSRPQTVSLRDPRSPTQVAHHLVLREGAVATSGSYLSARRVERVEVSHLIDALRAQPFTMHDTSVTVRASRCMDADALTKVVLFGNPETAQALLMRHDAEAILLRAAAAA